MRTDPGRGEGDRNAAVPLTSRDCLPNAHIILFQQIASPTRNSALITDGGVEQNDGEVEHLVCTQCDDNPTIARRNGRATVIFHCTHDDGPLDGVPLNSMALLPDPWEYVATDGGRVEDADGLEQYTDSDGSGDGALESGMREAVNHPGIDGTWHHYGALEWWDPEQLYGDDYARPICPVQHCATGEDHECRTICKRVNVDEVIKPKFINVDQPVSGAWFCVCHGWFRVYNHPRETAAEPEQAKLVTDGGRVQDGDGTPRTDGGATSKEILETQTEKASTRGPDEDRYDSSTEAARELLTEWVATHVDEQKIATAKHIVAESDREDIHINDVGRTLGCRKVGVTPDGFLEEVELSTWGDANVTSWVFERVDGHSETTEPRRSARLFKPELVVEISDTVGGLGEEYYRRTKENCRRVEVSTEWKRAVTLALVEASTLQLEELLTGYDEEDTYSFDEYIARLSSKELTNIVECVLESDEELGTPYGWPREMLIPIHDVLVSGIDPSEVT